jgi:hypothetical protein
MIRKFFLPFIFVSLAIAQDKVTVPLSNPSQPVTIRARLVAGGITVTTGTGPQVVIESTAPVRNLSEPDRNAPPGMHRIYAGGSGFEVNEENNVITIRPDRPGFAMTNLNVQVPVNTSVELKTINNGQIQVSGINGDIDVENLNGAINLQSVSGAISAHTLNGSINATVDRPASDKPMSFSSLNGTIDVTLPAATKANLRLKTTNGSVYSDFDVKMEPDTSKPTVDAGPGRRGRYRILTDHGAVGSINGGGPEYSFQTMNGTILIHKK